MSARVITFNVFGYEFFGYELILICWIIVLTIFIGSFIYFLYKNKPEQKQRITFENMQKELEAKRSD